MFRESSGNCLSPVHHHLEACQPLLITGRNLCEILCLRRRPSSACVCSLFSLRKSFFRSEHCVFVLTGFITDNIVCSSLLRLLQALGISTCSLCFALFLISFCLFLLTNMVCIISGLRNRTLEFSSNPKAAANYFLDQCLNSLCSI